MDTKTISAPSVPLLHGERLDEVNEHIRLIQKKNGLTFGTDAFLLAAYIRPAPRARAVDLGSGTGIIPLLSLSKNKVAHVTAVEIQPDFSELIARNAALNGFTNRLSPLLGDIRTLYPAQLGGEVEIVFSNPPYMRTDSGKRNVHDEKYIARHEVHGGIADFCNCAARLLKYGGKFLCVWRPDRFSELMQALANAKLEPKRMTLVHADRCSEPSMLLMEAVKGASPSLRVTPPLLLYRDRTDPRCPRQWTEQARRIYDTCLFPESGDFA